MIPTVSQLAFSMIRGMTPDIASGILEAVGSEDDFFRMSEKELRDFAQLSNRIFDEDYRNGLLTKAERELAFISEKGIRTVYFTDKDYPARFLTAPDAPLMLYAVGGCDLNARKLVSIVGTRHATNYGLGLCRDLVAGLAKQVGNDVVIVSGLAYGIDIAAHQAALDAGLPTVAVVAHGLDMIYPAQHRSAAAEIVRHGGAVVTEYPSSTRVHRSNFLARNRIVAALSDCTVVVESAEKGGALVTANIAQSYGREVFAFPGKVTDEYSAGCNRLIRKNVASLLLSAADLADAMGWERKEPMPVQQELFVELTAEEQQIVDLLGEKGELHINDLGAALNVPIHKLLSLLVDMEFRGLVDVLPGNRYAVRKNF